MDRPRLSSSTGRLGQILDVMAEAVTVTEADGKLVFANVVALGLPRTVRAPAGLSC
jgi:hypothetical protein